jgi:Cu(I)-responsive transcriptional regulator
MRIKEASLRSQLAAKTIRYYEEAGLLEPAKRRPNGYREYTEKDVHVLRFIRRARSLGFTVQDCRELLSLYTDQQRSSRSVRTVAIRRLGEIERKLAELQSLRDALTDLVDRCHGDHRPDCPILADLAGSVEGTASQ